MAEMTREQFRATTGGAKQPVATTKKPKLGVLGTAAKVTDTLFGGGKVGDAIGTAAAKGKLGKTVQKLLVGRSLTPQEEGNVSDGPSAGQVAGSAARSALLFLPVGKAAQGAAAGAKAVLPLASRGAAKVLGNAAVGAGTGYAADVAFNAAEGREDLLAPGAGTVVGGALPFVGAGLRGATRVVQEASGAATGAGFGSIKVGADAALAGGEKASAFRSALRGNVDGETIRKEAIDALTKIKQERTQAYSNRVAELKTSKATLDTGPVVKRLYDDLKNFGVSVIENPRTGAKKLDFSRSPGLSRYEGDVRQLVDTIEKWGSQESDNTILGIDKLKQTIRDFRRGGQESGRFDALVTTLSNEAKNLGKGEPAYEKLLREYGDASDVIDDITSNLSLGDKAMVDTGIRKLTSVLRTNNEFRRQLVEELNQQTGGTLIPKIAGQQLSELAPRGLARAVGGIGAMGGLATGVGIVPILQAALFTSPRVAGEVLGALGYAGRKAGPILKAMGITQAKVPWEAIFPGEDAPSDYLESDVRPTKEPAIASPTYKANATDSSSSIEGNGKAGPMTREQLRALMRQQ